MRYTLGYLALCAVVSGCAGITAKVLDETADKSDTGFRYYDTSPFLLVYTDGKASVESKLLYLPDTTKLRTIKPYNFGAKNDATFRFDKGRLIQAKAVVDETIIPNAVLAGLEKMATSKIKAFANNADGVPAPYLFRIVVKEDGKWDLQGQQAVPAIVKFAP